MPDAMCRRRSLLRCAPRRRDVLMLAAVAAVLIGACGDSTELPQQPADSAAVSVPPLPGSPTVAPELLEVPVLDPDSVAAGARVYAAHCANCHGADLKGDPDWMIPQDDGSYLPPPQDTSGHTWHHGDALLVRIITEGGGFPESKMPGFGADLAPEEISAVLDFFKSTWGPQERMWQWEQTLREREDQQ